MTDVAARAGVSHQTVSRVLNQPEIVRPATRERVLAAIDALGYRRNSSARALVTRRTRLIGVINAGAAFFGPGNIASAIESSARESGYATVTSGVQGTMTNPGAALDFFMNVGVDGLAVVAPTHNVAAAARRLAGRLPIVVVATGLESPQPLHVVAVDHEQGARSAVAHLIERGHRTIAHVSGPDDWFDARARLVGWMAELTRAGLRVPAPLAGGWDAREGYAAGERLLALDERPTAVFAANDLLAIGLMRRFHEAGVRVPEDIAIVGYDDSAGTDYLIPSLTTVRQPFEAVGQRTMRVMLDAIDGKSPADVLIIPTLIIRESSGPAR